MFELGDLIRSRSNSFRQLTRSTSRRASTQSSANSSRPGSPDPTSAAAGGGAGGGGCNNNNNNNHGSSSAVSRLIACSLPRVETSASEGGGASGHPFDSAHHHMTAPPLGMFLIVPAVHAKVNKLPVWNIWATLTLKAIRPIVLAYTEIRLSAKPLKTHTLEVRTRLKRVTFPKTNNKLVWSGF